MPTRVEIDQCIGDEWNNVLELSPGFEIDATYNISGQKEIFYLFKCFPDNEKTVLSQARIARIGLPDERAIVNREILTEVTCLKSGEQYYLPLPPTEEYERSVLRISHIE